MLKAALRDLQWRRRRFVITIIGTALVFAMSLLLSGLSNSFSLEVDRTLDGQAADWWITRDDAAGAFSPGSFLTDADLAQIAAVAPDAAAVLYGSSTAEANGDVVTVTVFGVQSGELGAPDGVELHDGEVVVPESLGVGVGDEVVLAGQPLTVVKVVDKASLLGGTPTLTITLADARRLLLGRQPLSSMVLVTGAEPALPDGFTAFDRQEARDDLMRPLENPIRSIDLVKYMLWVVAALIIASVVYLTVLERTRDIAVFKATGVGDLAIAGGICLQAVVLAVLSSLVGIVLALLLAPRFPMDVELSAGSVVALPLLAVVVGVLAGLVGVRRTTRVQPTTAFGGP